MRKQHRLTQLITFLGVLIATCAIYASTISSDLVFDDHWVVAGLDPLTKQNFLDHFGWTGRGVRSLTLRVDLHLFGTDYSLWHLQNLILHACNGLLVFAIGSTLLRRPIAAAVAALAFVAHPVQVESVANLANRKELLCAFFSLLSIAAWQQAGRSRNTAVRRLGFALGLGAAYLAINSKETAVVLPAIALLGSGFLQRWFTHLRRRAPRILAIATLTTVTLVLLLACPAIDRTLGDGHREGRPATLAGFAADSNDHSHIASAAHIFWLRAATLLDSRRVCPDRTYDPSLVPPWVLVTSWLALGLTVLGLLAARRSRWSQGGLWFGLYLLPVANLVPLAYPLADRYLYVPLAGFCVATAGAIAALMDKFEASTRVRGLALATATLVVAILGATAAPLASAWKSETSLWEMTLIRNPASFRAHINLGVVAAEAGSLQEAEQHFTAASEIVPAAFQPVFNRALVRAARGNLAGSLSDFRRSLEIEPTSAEARHHIERLERRLQSRRLWQPMSQAETTFDSIERIDARALDKGAARRQAA